MTMRLSRAYGSSPYQLTEAGRAAIGFGLPYRSGAHQSGTEDDIPQRLVDIANLERSTRRHMELQDQLAEALAARRIAAQRPVGWGPQFDLGFVYDGTHYVVEIKSGAPTSAQQARLGVGQVLEYRHLLLAGDVDVVQAVLFVESELPGPWPELANLLNVRVVRMDDLEGTLDALLAL
jgi:hypothetical protein